MRKRQRFVLVIASATLALLSMAVRMSVAATQSSANSAALIVAVSTEAGQATPLRLAQRTMLGTPMQMSPYTPSNPAKKGKKIKYPCLKNADGTVTCPPTLDTTKQPESGQNLRRRLGKNINDTVR